MPQYKLYIDMNKVAPEQLQDVIDIVIPDLAEPYFIGLRWLFARYNDNELAQTRAQQVKLFAHCGEVEVEEILTEYEKGFKSGKGMAQSYEDGTATLPLEQMLRDIDEWFFAAQEVDDYDYEQGYRDAFRSKLSSLYNC